MANTKKKITNKKRDNRTAKNINRIDYMEVMICLNSLLAFWLYQ